MSCSFSRRRARILPIISRSSIHAMTFNDPPHRPQVSMSLLKTRFRRCAQVIAAWHWASVFTSAFEPILSALPGFAGVTSPRHKGLATLLRADSDTVGHRTAQELGHGICLFGWIQVQPCAVAILLQQPLSFQATTCSLADQLNQIPQLVFNRCFDALESRGSLSIGKLPAEDQASEYLLSLRMQLP